jgi:hypothetical protein
MQTSRFLIKPRLFAAQMQPNAVRPSGPVPAAGRAERAAVVAAAGSVVAGLIRAIRVIRTFRVRTHVFCGIFAIHAQIRVVGGIRVIRAGMRVIRALKNGAFSVIFLPECG